MFRPVSLLPALVVVAVLAGLLAPAAAAGVAPARAAEDTPLTVTIESLTPTAIPRKGPIRVSGTVTNRDDQTWTSVSLYAFQSSAPMTTVAELAAAAATVPEDQVGERITTIGTFDTVDELAPGETARYDFTVPRSQIAATQAGVYWFGVHALGSGPEGSDLFADGRARTFLPLIPPRREGTVETALVLPLRHRTVYAADGSIANVAEWNRSLRRGSLNALVDLGATADSREVSWLVDPAVLDAVRRLADGNPPRSLRPTVDEAGADGDGEDGEDGAGETGSPSPSSSPDGEEGQGEEEQEDLDPRTAAAAAAATSWLDELPRTLEGEEVLTLPYGDLDVAAAAQHDPDAYREARKRGSAQLTSWGISTSPAVAPPHGYLDAAGIRLTETGTTTIVSDRMFRGDDPPSIARTEGRTLVVSSSAAAGGGPGPDDPLAPVAVRQRIASEAAVRLLDPDRPPLIVAFASTWSPQVDSNFFAGLGDLDWLELTTVTDAAGGPGTAVPAEDLVYPAEQTELELDAATFAAVSDLADAGETLQNLLTLNDRVGGEVRAESLTDLSYASRADSFAATTRADASRSWIETRLQSVRIDAPKAVILSSSNGTFAATVTNGLDQPVSVRVDAIADEPLVVATPDETIELGPDGRSTVLLNASSPFSGIRNLTLTLTDIDGVPLGSSDDLPVRSNRVSNVIWLIIGTGVALLMGAIAVRLFRRVRTARRAS